MNAKMRILGWISEGLRCPDHNISCCDNEGKPYKITLLQMPNGTGKTTTLNLIRAALSGSAENWTKNTVLEYKKKNSNVSYGKFTVKLSLNEKLVTIIMDFDFVSEKVSYKTTRANGQDNRFNPPLNFKRFMKEDFVDFFVFDGELAKSLLDKKKTNADRVVEKLFQVDTLKIVKDRVCAYWEERTSNASATEDRGLKRRQNKLEALNQRINQLKKNRSELEQQRDNITSNLESQKAKYRDEIKKQKKIAAEMDAAEENIRELRRKTKMTAAHVLEMMANPHALNTNFASDMFTFKQSLDRVKLPESAAREFFEELAQEKECICGRIIDDDIRCIIRSRAQQYLGSDDVALLNSIKSSIDDVLAQSLSAPEQALKSKIDLLISLDSDAQSAQNIFDQLSIDAESADPEAKKAKNRIEELETNLNKVTNEISKFYDKDDSLRDDRTYGIEVLEKRKNEAEVKLAEITHTIELKNKRDLLEKILESAFYHARIGITEDICINANYKISQLMPNNDIQLKTIDKCLILAGQSGGSAGEELSIAYGFLSTLFERAEHSLPFVVDSPAGPIDLDIRPKIGELIPKLSGQFIAFTISSERAGFVGRLKNSSSEPIQFITVFRKGFSQMEDSARTENINQENDDCFVVTGENFFNEFQYDSEQV